MNLIYTPSYASAHRFALDNEFAAGDWKWISDKDIIKQFSRADIYLGPDWQRHPLRKDIDEAIERARDRRRLGTVTDLSTSFATMGVSGA